MYYINYYPPDGSVGIPDDQYPPLHGRAFTTEAAARALIVRTIGDFGVWYPCENDLPPLHKSIVAYHENSEEGCGGYEIVFNGEWVDL